MINALKTHKEFRNADNIQVGSDPHLSADQLAALTHLQKGFKDQKLEPSFDDINAGNLLCPICGHTDTHQVAVDIQWRQEDIAKGLHISSNEDEEMYVSAEIDGSLGYRRQAIAITFWCEGCGAKSTLLIYQRKGRTYMEWDKESVFREIKN